MFILLIILFLTKSKNLSLSQIFLVNIRIIEDIYHISQNSLKFKCDNAVSINSMKFPISNNN
jgi:hypothetical protein